eukprot:tig00000900_g5379.t1
MVNAIRGMLVTCDIPTMTFVLFLDKEHKFVIQQLDDTHVLIDPRGVDIIKKRLAEMQAEITFAPLDLK